MELDTCIEPAFSWTEPDFSWATPEQNQEIAQYMTSVIMSFAKYIDKWAEEEVLPHTLNANATYGVHNPVEVTKKELHF